MKQVVLTIPTFGFIVATRAALGVGIGLLVSSRMPQSRRRQVGAALVAVGAATTIPAMMRVMRGKRPHRRDARRPGRTDTSLAPPVGRAKVTISTSLTRGASPLGLPQHALSRAAAPARSRSLKYGG